MNDISKTHQQPAVLRADTASVLARAQPKNSSPKEGAIEGNPTRFITDGNFGSFQKVE